MQEIIHPAATVVIASNVGEQLQILLLRRNPELAFAPNHWVFPGGKVELDELDSCNGDLQAASRLAAARECEEETGLKIDAEELLAFSHWTTPAIHPKRFATQFYLCAIANDSHAEQPPAVTVDQSEITDHQWLTPADALETYRQGELRIMPPTLVTLSEIERHGDYASLLRHHTLNPPRHYNPRIKISDGKPKVFFYEGDSGYHDMDPTLGESLNRCEVRDGLIHYECTLHDNPMRTDQEFSG